jgi:hypothetical protein
VPGPELVVEGVKEVKYDFKAARTIQRLKNGQFPALSDLKNAKNAFFYLKVLNKIYFQDKFLRNTLFLKIFCYLRRCGVIPVQSFKSHIRPQPPGLGLKMTQKRFRRESEPKAETRRQPPVVKYEILFYSLGDSNIYYILQTSYQYKNIECWLNARLFTFPF